MSTRRHRPGVSQSQWGKPERNADGKPVCRWCKGLIPAGCGFRCYCSQKCVDEWCVRSNAGYARRAVKRRDMGICQKCGVDCLWLAGVLKAWWKHIHNPAWNDKSEATERLRKTVRQIRRLGRWQADHIKPVVEGGGECGLDNLRTLCEECHLGETRELARRRAERRREEKAELFAQKGEQP